MNQALPILTISLLTDHKFSRALDHRRKLHSGTREVPSELVLMVMAALTVSSLAKKGSLISVEPDIAAGKPQLGLALHKASCSILR